MRRSSVWFLLALAAPMAGCSSWFGPTGDGVEAQCRRQAYDDPTVKQYVIASMGPSGANPQNQFDYEKALHDATVACMKKRGITVRGGVEPVRPF